MKSTGNQVHPTHKNQQRKPENITSTINFPALFTSCPSIMVLLLRSYNTHVRGKRVGDSKEKKGIGRGSGEREKGVEAYY